MLIHYWHDTGSNNKTTINQTIIMQLQVTIKNVYGEDKVYPACDQSRLLAQLAQTKTLTPPSLSIIKALGYSLEVITPSL